MERVAYSVKGAAEQLGVAERHIYRLLADGQLRSIKSRGRRLISHRALEDYIASLEQAAAS